MKKPNWKPKWQPPPKATPTTNGGTYNKGYDSTGDVRNGGAQNGNGYNHYNKEPVVLGNKFDSVEWSRDKEAPLPYSYESYI